MGYYIPMAKTFLTREDIQANRDFDRKLKAGVICSACGAAFGTYVASYKKVVVRDTNLRDCCNECAKDFA